jgi:lipopolysaccharide/colanic/teichoic acid biosynthesis glycosyltransferase
VVGPRPERAYFADGFRQVLQEYGLRHRLKAGITGWAQVHGLTGDTEVARRLEYDLYYLRHWSLALDLRILLMTVRTLGQALRE